MSVTSAHTLQSLPWTAIVLVLPLSRTLSVPKFCSVGRVVAYRAAIVKRASRTPEFVQHRRIDRVDSAISGTSAVSAATGLSNQSDPLELQMHMKKIINRLTSSVYRVVSVALFAQHQLIFSFMMCTAVMRCVQYRVT